MVKQRSSRWDVTINKGPIGLIRTLPIVIEDQTEGWAGHVDVSRYTRGVSISEDTHSIQLTAGEALELLKWLQDHTEVLVDMAVEDAIAIEDDTRQRQEQALARAAAEGIATIIPFDQSRRKKE